MCFGGKKGNHFWCTMYPRFVDFSQWLEFYAAQKESVGYSVCR